MLIHIPKFFDIDLKEDLCYFYYLINQIIFLHIFKRY